MTFTIKVNVKLTATRDFSKSKLRSVIHIRVNEDVMKYMVKDSLLHLEYRRLFYAKILIMSPFTLIWMIE